MNRAAAALVLLALLAHGIGLANGFVYDDHRFVVQNRALAGVSIADALLDPSTHTADLDRDVYRPLRLLGHAWDLRRWGPDPFGFHLHSILAHVAAVLVAYGVLRALLATGEDPRAGEAPALLGAGVLATHPLGVEVVGWVSSRGDLYGALLAWLALGLVTGRRAGRAATLVGAAVVACLAVLGKESALVVPAVAWAAWRLLGRGSRLAPWALGAGVAAALVLRQAALSGASPVQTPPHGGDAWTQVAWALHGLGRTLGALVLPTGLSVEYPQDSWAQGPIPVWIRPRTLLGLAAVVAPFALRGLGRRRAAFLAAWPLLAWLPSGSLLVTLRDLVNDRAAYPLLPAAGALLGLAVGEDRRRAWVLLLVVATPLAWLSVERTQVFRDDAALWTDVLRKDSRSVRAHLGLATVVEDEPRRRAHLAHAVENSRPGSKLEAIALAQLGDHVLHRGGDAGHALPVLERALPALRRWESLERPLAETEATAASLAQAYEELGRSADAEAVLDEAIERSADPTVLLVRRALLRLVRTERDTSDANVADLEQAIRAAEAVRPDHPLVRSLRPLVERRRAGAPEVSRP